MKKALVLAAVLAGLAALGRVFGSRMQNIDWEKRITALPDNAPPKWMFRNITAIRENTEKILEVPRISRTGDPLGSFSEKVRARASESTEVLPGVQR
jgi:hypothetical protein